MAAAGGAEPRDTAERDVPARHGGGHKMYTQPTFSFLCFLFFRRSSPESLSDDDESDEESLLSSCRRFELPPIPPRSPSAKCSVESGCTPSSAKDHGPSSARPQLSSR